MILHTMHRLNKSGVIDDNIVKLVIGPDNTDLLLETVEKLEAANRAEAVSRAIQLGLIRK